MGVLKNTPIVQILMVRRARDHSRPVPTPPQIPANPWMFFPSARGATSPDHHQGGLNIHVDRRVSAPWWSGGTKHD